MTYLRVLALVLCCFTAFHSYSEESITSPNLIDNSQWNGATYGNDPGGCCASISGSGALYDNLTDTILYSYGSDLLSQTIAINQALQATGIQVDGYKYGWTYKMVSNNGNMGSEQLIFTVEVKDSNGNLVETYQYDRSWGAGPYNFIRSMDTWYTDSGTETFATPYPDPQSITLKILGKDGGFWAGYYGPEVKDVNLQLIYSANPCAADPLYDPLCPGYAAAYASKMLEEQMAAQQTAILETPNVETTATTEPTTITITTPVISGGTIDNGSSSGDTGSLSSQETTDKENDNKSKLALAQSLDAANNFDLSSVTGGASNPDEDLANDIVGAAEAAAADTIANLTQSSIESSRQEEQQVSQQETVVTQNSFDQMGGTSNEMGMGSTQAQDAMGMDTIQTEVQSSLASTQVTRPVETRQERRERLKEITEDKANEISEKNADADSMDDQTKQQTEQLALMNYVPGFDAYQTFLPGGVYPDVPFYKPTTVPESRRGLRNGLAQQLLHDKMVQMQYERGQ